MKFKCAFTELVPLHKLIPNPKNPNSHSDEQVERLSKIIDFQGQRSPIVVSKRSGFITKGHGRLLAIQKLGWEKAAVDFQDYESDAQEYADIVADNAIAEWSKMDIGQINAEFLDFGPEMDIELLGLKDFTIDPAETELPEMDGEDPACQTVSFILSTEQKDLLDDALKKAQREEEVFDGINQNKNGNTLAAILRRYVYG